VDRAQLFSLGTPFLARAGRNFGFLLGATLRFFLGAMDAVCPHDFSLMHTARIDFQTPLASALPDMHACRFPFCQEPIAWA